MSVLSVIQRHCQMHALAVPSAIVGSTDSSVIQLLAILGEVLEDMIVESKYQAVTYECVFTLSSGENQGPLSSLGGGTFGLYQPNFETFYDRTLARPLYGPLSDTEWQQLKALPNSGPFTKFRIWQNALYITPAPSAPFSTVVFEYMSSWAVRSASGTPQSGILNDSDVFALPEHIIRKWMMFRWKQIKGLPYQEDEERAYDMLNNYIARDKVKNRVNLAGGPKGLNPGILVPSGNWPV